MSNETPNGASEPRPCRRRRRGWLIALFIGAAAVFGFAAGKVHSSPWWHFAGHHHPFDADEISFIVEHRIDKVLTKVDATAEQRDKIKGIAKAAIGDVTAMRKEPMDRRQQFLTLLKADSLDKPALEALRAGQLVTADTATKRILKAVEDAAEVLTPEQRRKLAERWENWPMHR